MATVKITTMAALGALACGCGKLDGLGGASPPLVTFTVQVDDTPGVLTGSPSLNVALVWGRQWLVEPLCILPPDPRDDAQSVAAVIAAGCRDPFGFVPARVAAVAPIVLGEPTTIDLFTLPAADIMVGDLTARVAYGSFVVFDDRDGDGLFDLAQPNRPPDMNRPGDNLPTNTTDRPYGGSFVAMTRPDQRVAFREGAFIQSGFYPRAGCGDPPDHFSVVAASGFTVQAAIDATLAGTVPQETDPSMCAQDAPAAAAVSFQVESPVTSRDVAELACTERLTDSTVRYREPDADAPDMTNRKTACVHYPSFGDPSDVVEFVISGRDDDSCVGLTHYILKGCREGPECGSPDWDDAPPSWWPC
jgi:hypothetical protein